jgi:hypothetical protein
MLEFCFKKLRHRLPKARQIAHKQCPWRRRDFVEGATAGAWSFVAFTSPRSSRRFCTKVAKVGYFVSGSRGTVRISLTVQVEGLSAA